MEYALSPEGLYEAAQKCFKGTDWKASVATFELNVWERCLQLSEELNDGAYRPRDPVRFTITRPKRRELCSICIRDRVFQRSLNDNVVYPAMSKSLIKENCACQKGKGTDYARDLFAEQLRNCWHHRGTDGYALCMDVRGYYPNMRHDVALACFKRYLEPEEYAWVRFVLSTQYAGDIGFQPGSQLVQIAGISVLSPLDHFIKERLRRRWYVRYMDDMLVLCESKEDAERVKSAVAVELAKMGYELNASKTRIVKLGGRIPFLGFTYELRPTGKVVCRVKREKTRDQRKRILRMAEALDEDTVLTSAGTTYRYLVKRCSDRAGPEKYRTYCNAIFKERGWNTGKWTTSAPSGN